MRIFDGLIISCGIFGGINSFNLFQQLMAMKYQQSHLNGANTASNLGLTPEDQREVLLNVNNHSPNMGYSPLELLLGNKGTKNEIVTDIKQGYMGTIRTQMQDQYPNPLTDVLLPYSKTDHSNSRISADTVTPNEVFGQYIHEPMRTIMLLKTHPHPDVRARGDILLKKAFARCLQHATQAARDQCRKQ